MFQKDDYVEGFEYYGHVVRRMKGWINSIQETKDGLVVNIQCDDSYDGYRGNSLYGKLGTIVKLEDKPRIKI